MVLKLGIETYQILTNDDEVCIPRRSSIDILCRQQIKLFQVVSISEFHEY